MSPLALIVVGAFIIVSLIVVGVYWMLIVRPETEGRTKLHKRLKVSAGDIGTAAVTTKLEKKGQDDVKSGVDQMVERMSIIGPIQELIKQADVKISVAAFIFLSAMCFVGAYVGIFFALRFHLVALGVASLAMFIPFFYIRHKRNARFWKFEEVLDNLANVIRERFQVKRQVRVLTAHGRITGWILAGFPPALALAMFIMSPGHLNVMVEDPLGIQMIVAAVLMQIIGTLLIRKLVNIEY